jgi:hypothetical protein
LIDSFAAVGASSSSVGVVDGRRTDERARERARERASERRHVHGVVVVVAGERDERRRGRGPREFAVVEVRARARRDGRGFERAEEREELSACRRTRVG